MKNQTRWSKEQREAIVRAVNEGVETKKIAKDNNTTPGAIRGLCRRMGVSLVLVHSPASLVHTTLDEDRGHVREKLRQKEHVEVRKKYLELVEERELDDRVVELFRSTLGEAYGSKFKIEVRPFRKEFNGTSVDEEAMLIISDTHVGKIVIANETNGFGLYNPLRFLAKLQHLERTVTGILQERNNCPFGNPIRRLHIALLGDLVDGMLNHSEEIPGHTYVSQQVHLCSLALFQTIARLALQIDEVVIYGVPGNHGRWPNQRKMPTTGRFSNLDTITLEWLQSLFDVSPIKNVRFKLGRSPHQIIDILGTRICCSHGDELHGGDKAMGVPVHAIARQINSMTQRLAARNEPVPRYYIVGDKHKRIELPTARGSFMVNGAWPGVDGYSLAAGFSETLPEQLFFGIHPRFGKSWSYNLNISDDMVPEAKLDDLDFRLPESVREDIMKFEQ